MPGTGKTILAIYLLKPLRDEPKYKDWNIRILEPITDLRSTVSEAVGSVNGLSKKDVIGPYDLTKAEFGYRAGEKKCFDILLVDEAHHLKRRVNLSTQFRNYDKVNEKLGLRYERSSYDATQLDWVLDQSKIAVLFYDPLQITGPSSVGRQGLIATLSSNIIDGSIKLETQMRCRGGTNYINYIYRILNEEYPQPQIFSDYEFVLHDEFSDFVESSENTFSKHELTRYVAGYAWKWDSKNKVEAVPPVYDIEIDGIKLRWNRSVDQWIPKGEDNSDIGHEVGCIHTTQGYDLNYAYVIIGNDLKFNTITGHLEADKNNYFDKTGKNTATQEELTTYIKNIYYVLLTRGIEGTHVYVCNPVLRAYFAQFFPEYR